MSNEIAEIASAPSYVGIGAEKSGTTWWHRLIMAHPEVHTFRSGDEWTKAGSDKELKFFNRFCSEPFTEQSIAEYAGQFKRPLGNIAGEWTPRYMYDPWTPPLLQRAAPNAKIILMLRDPLQRFHSGLTHSAKLRLANFIWMVNDALHKSAYARQLEHVMRFFDRSQLLVLQFEKCSKDPLEQLRRTYAFIGCKQTDYLPPKFDRVVNKTQGEKVQVSSELLAHVADYLAEETRRTIELFPDDLDPALWSVATANAV